MQRLIGSGQAPSFGYAREDFPSFFHCGVDLMKTWFRVLLPLALLGQTCLALAQTKWDLPAAYPATNFHTVNLNQFAADIDKASKRASPDRRSADGELSE